MRRRVIVSFTALAVLALAACGSSSKPASGPPTTTVVKLSDASWEKAGPAPSLSAKMICQKEARDDIAGSIGVTAIRLTKPTWVVGDHVYSCTYVYPNGRITLSVKELVNEQTTTAYFDGLRKQYGSKDPLYGMGQGGWVLSNNDVVVRKDYKVLFVDVHGIPASFAPSMTRSDVATEIAAAIMGCWSGA